jgi:hypothetical protein
LAEAFSLLLVTVLTPATTFTVGEDCSQKIRRVNSSPELFAKRSILPYRPKRSGAQSRRSSSQAETQKTSPLDWSWKLIWGARLRDVMADHTGQSSQLFPVTTGRNAQFLSRLAKTLARKSQRSISSFTILSLELLNQLGF